MPATQRHLDSTIHRQGRRIAALLRQDCLTLREIGKRVGVSDEQVRNIATAQGMKRTRHRRRQCAVTKASTTWRRHPLIIALPGHLTIEPQYANWRFSTRRVIINGRSVLLRYFSTRCAGWYSLQPLASAIRDEFVASYNATIGQWIVIPSARYPIKGTTFAPNPVNAISDLDGKFHDWPRYIDAWYLLASP
jgi:hypothetical protein